MTMYNVYAVWLYALYDCMRCMSDRRAGTGRPRCMTLYIAKYRLYIAIFIQLLYSVCYVSMMQSCKSVQPPLRSF